MRRKEETKIGVFTSGYKCDFVKSNRPMIMVTEEVARAMTQAKLDADMTEAVNRKPKRIRLNRKARRTLDKGTKK